MRLVWNLLRSHPYFHEPCKWQLLYSLQKKPTIMIIDENKRFRNVVHCAPRLEELLAVSACFKTLPTQCNSWILVELYGKLLN